MTRINRRTIWPIGLLNVGRCMIVSECYLVSRPVFTNSFSIAWHSNHHCFSCILMRPLHCWNRCPFAECNNKFNEHLWRTLNVWTRNFSRKYKNAKLLSWTWTHLLLVSLESSWSTSVWYSNSNFLVILQTVEELWSGTRDAFFWGFVSLKISDKTYISECSQRTQ